MKEKRVKVTLTVWVPGDEFRTEEQVASQCAEVIEANEDWHVSDWDVGSFKKGRRDEG